MNEDKEIEKINKLTPHGYYSFLTLIGLATITLLLIIGFVVFTTNNTGLTQEDKDYLVELEYSGGFCERLGLKSVLMIQKTPEGLEYGVPVCVEHPDYNGGN